MFFARLPRARCELYHSETTIGKWPFAPGELLYVCAQTEFPTSARLETRLMCPPCGGGDVSSN